MVLITVACVLKTGGVYDRSWVERLRRGVARHLRQPHRFVCLTDDKDATKEWTDDIEWRPLHHDWPGWWSKIEVYALPGAVLYLDLDVAVVGALDPLLEVPTAPFDGRSFGAWPGLTAIRDWMRPDQINTSVLRIETRNDIYSTFRDQADMIMESWRGDQEWLSAVCPDTHVWPDGLVVSFRKHCRARLMRKDGEPASLPPPKGACVVAFHGQPKMPDANGWPKEYWAI